MISYNNQEFSCTMELTLHLIGGKWKGLILWHLGQLGVVRFGELKRLHPRLSHKMLTQQLRELESHGIIERQVYQQVPPKVEYSLSEIGRRLLPVLVAMCAWGDEYLENASIPGRCTGL